MKLVRFGEYGKEKPGMVDASGAIRDLSSVVADINPATIAADMPRLAKLNPNDLPKAPEGARLGEPVKGASKFIAIGLNYYDHAKEVGAEIPKEPVIFTKTVSCIQGPNDPVMIPKGARKVDWEAELGIVIGRRARYVSEADSLNYVAGYCLVNDVSEREYQIERGGLWDKGKGCDTFGPVGPWLVTPDEIPDPQNLKIWLAVNGETMQSGNTSTMIFGVKTLVSYVSQFMTLEPGDIITTGTPPGVGLGRKPPRFLQPGDVMTLGIAGLGEQRQEVIAFDLNYR
jgi:2-keto-4-pentenoate hydratase/2-oxohepta-3-ene-1,7-dioic acid hydratase in catechol pathway